MATRLQRPVAAPPATGSVAVQARGVVRTFGERVVLDGVDLTIRQGEFVALLGRSGSGKSTLLRILSGFDREVDGTLAVARRRAIVFQEPRLLPWRRVLPNVAIGLRGSDVARRTAAALDEVGLADRSRSWPATLSGGEAQRVALARALVREPALLLLDEPFGALDALTRLRMQALLKQLCARHRPAVLLVTHDVDEAIQLADRVLVLRDGRISFEATVTSGIDLRTHVLRELGVLSPHQPKELP